MIKGFAHANHFAIGRKIALAEVRDYQEAGLWTEELRTRLMRNAILQKRHMERNYPEIPGVITYYAGRISVLKSHVTAQFCEKHVESDMTDLLSLFDQCQQEQMREAVIYTTASGWDWEQDDEEERDLIYRERALPLSLFDVQFGFHETFTWLCICIICFTLFPAFSVYCVVQMLISLAFIAYETDRTTGI